MTGSSPEREVMAVKKNEHLIASIKVRDRVARGSLATTASFDTQSICAETTMIAEVVDNTNYYTSTQYS